MLRAMKLFSCYFGSGAGGGGTPTSSTPEYLVTSHARMLSGDVPSTALTAFAGSEGMLEQMENIILDNESPFFNESAYNPDSDIYNAEHRGLDSYSIKLNSLNPEIDWEGLSDKALAVVDESSNKVFDASGNLIGGLDSAIQSIINAAALAVTQSGYLLLVSAYEDSVQARLSSELSKMGGAMADINAVHSSAFAIAEALIRSEVQKDVNKYEHDLTMDQYRVIVDSGVKAQLEAIVKKHMARDAYISQGVAEMNKMFLAQIDAEKQKTILYHDYYFKKIIAKKEEVSENLAIDAKDAMWDMEVFAKGGNMIAALSGASSTTMHELTPFQTALQFIFGTLAK